MGKPEVDYSLYLVTDSSMLPAGSTIYSQVEEGLKNGVTLVQVREKDCDTKDFVWEAANMLKLCRRYGVPMVINDRVDVALAVGADGVHVGQDDMPIPMVRDLLGPDKLLGWSVSKAEEVKRLADWGPGMIDNVGIGTLFPTNTKKDPKKSPMGPQGVIKVLDALEEYKADWCKSVAIGGIHPDNVERVIYQCVSSNGLRSLDGIAVVSDIMASADPAASAKNLRTLLQSSYFNFVQLPCKSIVPHITNISKAISQVSKNRPLIQHITNKVHQNFGANVTLALGSSPIMSENPLEAIELSQVPHAALLLNTGTVASFETLNTTVIAYNNNKRPIVFDPVGYNATSIRLNLNNNLLSQAQFTCIKGNTSEILALSNLTREKMHGVDALQSSTDLSLLVKATRTVAFKYRTVAVCTGEYDIVVDGIIGKIKNLSTGTNGVSVDNLPCFIVQGGPIPIMGEITASGCSLGSTIASFLGGVNDTEDILTTVISAIVLYKAAGKLAATRAKGSGSFQIELIDSLYQLFRDNQPESWPVSYRPYTGT